MRILLVIEPSGGGSGRHVIDLAQALIEADHAVSLIYSPLRAEPRFEAEAAALSLRHLEPLPMRRAVGPWDLGTVLALRRLIARLGPFDVVHGHSTKAGALARLAAPASAARVYTPHAFATQNPGARGAWLYGAAETLLAWAFCEAVIAVSAEEAVHARRRGLPADRLHVVPNGLATSPSQTRLAARRFLGLSDDQRVVGFVGRLSPQKNPVLFAQAVRLAQARDPRILGVLIGEGELSEAVRAAGGAAVRLLGALDARPLMAGFDLFAVTSRYEGLAYAMLEAAAAGLPILSSEVGGVSLLAEAGVRIDALPLTASPEQWAEALTAALDRTDAASPGSPLPDRLSAARMAADTVEIYRLACARRRSARG